MMEGKTVRVLYAAAQSLYWAQSAVGFAFAAFFLQQNGFSAAAVGWTLAAVNLFGVLLPNILGTLIDRGKLSCGAAAGMVLAAETLSLPPLLTAVRPAWLTAASYAAFLSLMLTAGALYTKIYVDLQRRVPSLRYGSSRALGSVSFALCAWGMGLLLDGRPLWLLPACALLLTLMQGAVLLRMSALSASLPAAGQEDAAPGSPMGRFLRDNARFALLLAGIAVIFAANNTINNYLYLIVRELGGTERTLGALNAFIGLIEMPVMLLYARRARPRPQRLLALSLVFFPLKLLAVWAAGEIGTLFAAFALQALSFALYVPAMVDYVDRTIPFSDSAKGQSLSASMISLGTLAATLCSGYWLDALPVKAVLLRLTLLAAAGLPLCLAGIGLQKKDKDRKKL